MLDFFNNNLDANKAYDQYLDGKAVFIDIREEEELSSGLVKDALWLPLSRLEQEGWIEKLKKLSENKELFFYCRSGGRVANLQNYLRQYGIASKNLGGFESIKASNVPYQMEVPSESLLELNL